MGACLQEVRAWHLECSVTNSCSYAGHESYKRHERHAEAVGCGRGNGVSAKKLLSSARQAGQLQAAHIHTQCERLHSHWPP